MIYLIRRGGYLEQLQKFGPDYEPLCLLDAIIALSEEASVKGSESFNTLCPCKSSYKFVESHRWLRSDMGLIKTLKIQKKGGV